MTVKFIITGDLHYRGVNPRARLDNFKEALSRKLYEVYDLAGQYQAKAIIIPGDVFDGPSPGWGTAAELGMIIQAAPCPVLVIPGNHDVWAGNPGSKHRTPFGMLSRLGLMWDLTDEPFEAEDKEPFDIAITGHGFTVETDTELGKGQFALPAHMEVWDGTAIHVVHSMLMDHSPGFEMRHTLISQVETTAQVIISGHEHIGFGIHRRDDGVLFINPGALCRLSAHHEEIARRVQVALLTVHENGETEAELIPLKCAAPGHEVLSRAHLEAEAERNDRLEKFLALLASEGESKFLEVREIVEDIAAREQLPGEVKTEALKRIGEAREILGVG
jgi:exonuclease SbcD